MVYDLQICYSLLIHPTRNTHVLKSEHYETFVKALLLVICIKLKIICPVLAAAR